MSDNRENNTLTPGQPPGYDTTATPPPYVNTTGVPNTTSYVPPQYGAPGYPAQPPYYGQPQPYPQQYPPQQYPPQQYPPQQSYPPQHVVVQQPSTVVVTRPVGVEGEQDVLPAMIIFFAGWFGICCIWLGGFMYLKSKNPTARTFSWMSVAMYFTATVCLVFWIIYATVITAATASSYSGYDYSSDYYDY